MIVKVFVYLSLTVAYLRADYDCLCNYNVEKGVFTSPSEQSQPIGYLYEFDCKPTVAASSAPADWTVVAYEHQKGYVSTDAQTRVQVCPGDVSPDDKLPTSPVPIVQTTATTTTIAQETSTSNLPSTASTKAPTIEVFASSSSTTPTTEETTVIKLTTTSPSPTTVSTTGALITSTQASSSTLPSTSTQSATTVQLMTTTTDSSNTVMTTAGALVCPMNVQQSALQESGTLFINAKDQKCYEMVTTPHSWEFAERDCKQKGGHLATIGDALDEELVYRYVKLYGHAAWIGLHDINKEEHFEWASGEPVAYLNWHSGRKDYFLHGFEDCVAMGPLTGTWEDLDCLSRYAYICEFDAVYGSNYVPTTVPAGSYTDGNTNMCPTSVKSAANHDNAVLGQYGRSCYELITHSRVRWEHGESMCKSRGGHLAHIYSAEEQGYVQYFMNRHSPQHAVWIGLHDTRVEGQFEWTAGKTVGYTNWVPGHVANFESSRTEDCVAFIPYKNGQWDDIPCGSQSFLFGDSGETHPILCQYDVDSSQIVVG